ncbi:MAG: M23 family metallopeptidase [Gemmatimonadales bacterium]|jgi:murein DD-endopeptidase MepM/ murein hydrolase activator NlpD
MANHRWTVMLVPHGSDGSKALSVSGTLVKLVAGVATVVAASMLAATIGVVSHSVDLARSQRLERANQALSTEVQRLNQRVGVLSDTLTVISRRDEEMRLVAGLEPLSPEVQQAGIGGPAGAWPEREQLLTEGGSVGREAFSVHTDLDALIRRANLLATSFQEAAESIAAHTQEMAAMPSIMPTMGFLTSKFSFVRYHPILHENRPHEGIDITAAYGTKIIAPAAGRVIKVGYENGYGNLVAIDHGYGLETRYAHMSRWAVRVGQNVKRGDLLGYVGSTGLSTGPHLHYEVLRDGRAVDPLKFILPDAIAD